ncbi:MAG: single-stranded DNA-binding protein [Peptococcaceae bacterium]|jgi:single-strand DNA-binding protein|nr:single-stranded DNA-binding protein [Peptococcaceae bacterium]
MLNRIILIGRLTRDPELRYTQSGTAVARMSLAVERDFRNAAGEKETDFIDIVAWRKLAELCANHLGKGRLVAVEGRLQIRPWEKDGVKHRSAEVVADGVQFLDRPREAAAGGPPMGAGDDDPPYLDDEVPF